MRSPVLFPMLLVVVAGAAAPTAAWSGPLDQPRRTSMNGGQPIDPSTLCETAITTAEYVARLPARMLGAVALTESGRVDPASGRQRPWPWTINAEGEGQFFATKPLAVAAAKALQARGVRSIDVGCMQVNLMYHPDAFAHIEDAFDPRLNAAYAARFLNALYTAARDWPKAIAAYHSETPALGDAYRALVMARWQVGDMHAVAPIATAYADFARRDVSYGAFAASSRVYGAFAGQADGR